MQKLQTKLKDRILRFDGISVIEPEFISDLLFCGVKPSQMVLTEESKIADDFNNLVSEEDRILINGNSPVRIDSTWILPEKYLVMDITDRIAKDFSDFLLNCTYSDAEKEKAFSRITDELDQIKKRGMTNFIRTIIYVIDTLRLTNSVWGVGRGSSCASYILFILGVHVVDCIKYNISLEEFFHD